MLVFEVNFNGEFNIITAESGSEGLKILKNQPNIEIVVSDMMMPEMNGIEFIKKAKEQFSNIVYFILTGYDITEDISAALNDKLINDYFKKPFNAKEVETSIKAAFE